jgi:hypothetical protein
VKALNSILELGPIKKLFFIRKVCDLTTDVRVQSLNEHLQELHRLKSRFMFDTDKQSFNTIEITHIYPNVRKYFLKSFMFHMQTGNFP